MSSLTSSMRFILFFLVMTLVVAMAFGPKVATYFLTLILLGMVITNPDKIVPFIEKFAAAPTSVTTKGPTGTQGGILA